MVPFRLQSVTPQHLGLDQFARFSLVKLVGPSAAVCRRYEKILPYGSKVSRSNYTRCRAGSRFPWDLHTPKGQRSRMQDTVFFVHTKYIQVCIIQDRNHTVSSALVQTSYCTAAPRQPPWQIRPLLPNTHICDGSSGSHALSTGGPVGRPLMHFPDDL